MYITNIEEFNENYVYKCDEVMAKYLLKNHIPLLGRKNKTFYFSKTKGLNDVLEKGGEKYIE